MKTDVSIYFDDGQWRTILSGPDSFQESWSRTFGEALRAAENMLARERIRYEGINNRY